MTIAAAADPVARFRAAFESRPPAEAHAEARRAAFARFAELGFPAAREEAWKYTSLRRLETRSFAPTTREHALAAPVVVAPALALHRALLVNGHFDVARSMLDGLPPGLRVRSFAEHAGDVDLRAWSRIPAGGGTERFAALNAAFFGDALLVELDAEARCDTALHVAMHAAGHETAMSHPRIIVRLARDASLALVIQHVGDDGAERFVNTMVDIELGERSELRLYRLQQQGLKTFHIERIDAGLGPAARIAVRDASFGATLSRVDVNVRLAGAGSAAEVTGLFLADGTRHIDTQLRVEHRATGTTSVQDYRGIAAGRGRGVFNGRVVVHEGAQKSNSRQTSRNLLLTPGAEIDTKPELEIHADDVQCSHGATTGQLDPAALFYLRSRGLDAATARNALTRAFAAAVLSRIELGDFERVVHGELDTRLDRLLEVTP